MVGKLSEPNNDIADWSSLYWADSERAIVGSRALRNSGVRHLWDGVCLRLAFRCQPPQIKHTEEIFRLKMLAMECEGNLKRKRKIREWVFWLQPVSSGTGDRPEGGGKNTRRCGKREKLLRKAVELQEGWHSFLESPHCHSHQG